jgi:hypothetical protein
MIPSSLFWAFHTNERIRFSCLAAIERRSPKEVQILTDGFTGNGTIKTQEVKPERSDALHHGQIGNCTQHYMLQHRVAW